MVFEFGDWVWLYMHKERFPIQRRNKLLPCGNGPFQVSECIKDNAYKLELSDQYGVSATFNVSDLSPFAVDDVFNLRTNPSQEDRNDNTMGDVGAQVSLGSSNDQVLVSVRPIIREHAKKFKDQLNIFVHVVREAIEGS